MLTEEQAVSPDELHRLQKYDTSGGLEGLRRIAEQGVVPYVALLYERVLGRPFASHRDATSESVGRRLEHAIQDCLDDAHIPYYKCERAERTPGFDQAPDIVIPGLGNPRIMIEAKISEDDGTARDKITRIQHLCTLAERSSIEVIACIDGRGFAERRQDLRKLLRATKGRVFTLATLDRLVETTSLSCFAGTATP